MVAAVAPGADETFEMIDAGVGVALVSAGNADLYRREGVVACPVAGLAPCGWPSPGAGTSGAGRCWTWSTASERRRSSRTSEPFAPWRANTG